MAKKKNGSVCCISDDDWKAESDLRTLVEAEKIKKDKKRFAAAQAKAKEQLLEVASVASEESESK